MRKKTKATSIFTASAITVAITTGAVAQACASANNNEPVDPNVTTILTGVNEISNYSSTNNLTSQLSLQIITAATSVLNGQINNIVIVALGFNDITAEAVTTVPTGYQVTVTGVTGSVSSGQAISGTMVINIINENSSLSIAENGVTGIELTTPIVQEIITGVNQLSSFNGGVPSLQLAQQLLTAINNDLNGVINGVTLLNSSFARITSSSVRLQSDGNYIVAITAFTGTGSNQGRITGTAVITVSVNNGMPTIVTTGVTGLTVASPTDNSTIAATTVRALNGAGSTAPTDSGQAVIYNAILQTLATIGGGPVAASLTSINITSPTSTVVSNSAGSIVTISMSNITVQALDTAANAIMFDNHLSVLQIGGIQISNGIVISIDNTQIFGFTRVAQSSGANPITNRITDDIVDERRWSIGSAPYIDVSSYVGNPYGNSRLQITSGPNNPDNFYIEAQQSGYTIAFIQQTTSNSTSVEGSLAGNGINNNEERIALTNIEKLRTHPNGRIALSFGGALGIPIWTFAAMNGISQDSLNQEFVRLLNLWEPESLDFDIEGTHAFASTAINTTAITMLATSMAYVRANGFADIKISLTSAVLGRASTSDAISGNTTGFQPASANNSSGLPWLNIFMTALGPTFTAVALAMNGGVTAYANGYLNGNPFTNPAAQFVIDVIDGDVEGRNGLKNQYQSAAQAISGVSLTDEETYSLVGIVPMIGVNDTSNQIVLLNDWRAILDFAELRQLGIFSWWATERDHYAGGGTFNTNGLDPETHPGVVTFAFINLARNVVI